MAKRTHFECPNCGAVFRSGRLACPECGSDAETGWRDAEDLDYLAVDLPEVEPEDGAPVRRGKSVAFIVAAIAALIAMLAFALT